MNNIEYTEHRTLLIMNSLHMTVKIYLFVSFVFRLTLSFCLCAFNHTYITSLQIKSTSRYFGVMAAWRLGSELFLVVHEELPFGCTPRDQLTCVAVETCNKCTFLGVRTTWLATLAKNHSRPSIQTFHKHTCLSLNKFIDFHHKRVQGQKDGKMNATSD